MTTKPTAELRPHPKNVGIYGDHADTDLIESIRAKGILTPLLITADGRVISGNRRLEAARRLNLPDVPVVLFGSSDELDILEALIESNRQRHKTNEQLGREALTLMEVEAERARRRQAVRAVLLPENFPEVKPPVPLAAAGRVRPRPPSRLVPRGLVAHSSCDAGGCFQSGLLGCLAHHLTRTGLPAHQADLTAAPLPDGGCH
jgi:hypothetical protein